MSKSTNMFYKGQSSQQSTGNIKKKKVRKWSVTSLTT